MSKATAAKKLAVGTRVEWVGKGNQYRRGTITRILNGPRTNEPFAATVQPEEVAVPLDGLTRIAPLRKLRKQAA